MYRLWRLNCLFISLQGQYESTFTWRGCSQEASTACVVPINMGHHSLDLPFTRSQLTTTGIEKPHGEHKRRSERGNSFFTLLLVSLVLVDLLQGCPVKKEDTDRGVQRNFYALCLLGTCTYSLVFSRHTLILEFVFIYIYIMCTRTLLQLTQQSHLLTKGTFFKMLKSHLQK